MKLSLAFRIFYTSFFSLLNLVLLALLLITPADAIRQALNNRQIYNIFVIAGGYLLTVLLAILIYAARLYTNRSVLAGIPKTWIPVEKGEVNKKVRKMIVASLSRSAAIAWDSRPRVAPQPTTIVSVLETRDPVAKAPEPEEGKKEYGCLRKRRTQPEKDEHTVTIPPHQPVWGEISHNGWSSPTSLDLPNLQYTTVVLELPHLIEARAVSLAPPDPDSTTEPPMPDIQAVSILQRPASMGLRDYITHLTSLGVITSPALATPFLSTYEYARFSSRPLTEPRFRDLMKQFSEVLRSIKPLSPVVLASLDIDPPESDIDDDASSTPTERSRSLTSAHSVSSRSGSEGTIRTAPSRRVGTNGSPGTRRKKTEFSTAPATPRSKKRVVSRTPSVNSFAQSRVPYNGGGGTSSSESLRSTSQGSVIKLSRTNEDGELPEVPYVLTIPRTRER
jgi:hypothetical protein